MNECERHRGRVLSRAVLLLPQSCPGCGTIGPAPCAQCVSRLRRAPDLPPPPGVDRCVSLFVYEGVGATIIRRLKYANHRDGVASLSAALAIGLSEPDFDHLTWVPSAPVHLRARGFDQARLIARSFGRPERLLRRLDDCTQTGRNRTDRLAGPALAPIRRLAGTVVLIDDVRTTGASLSAAARALRVAGVSRVVAATLAATPADFGP